MGRSAFLEGFCILAALILTAFFVHLGWTGYISDSEIWSVTLAKHFGQEWFHPWVATRPWFYSVLALFEAPVHGSIPIFMAAKIASLMNGLAILFFTYRLAKSLCDPSQPTAKIVPWLSLILLVSNSGFLNQGYRIRSDLFACTLVLFVLERTIVAYRADRRPNFLFWASPLLATPKAVLQIVPLLAFWRKSWISAEWIRRRGWILIALVLAAALAAFPLYRSSWLYFMHTFSGLRTDLTSRFVYVEKVLRNNPIFVGAYLIRLATLGLRTEIRDFRSSVEDEIQRRFVYLNVVAVIVILVTPEKVPFFLASFLPLFTVFAALVAEDLWALKRMAGSFWQERLRILAWAAVFFVATGLLAKGFREHQLFAEENGSAGQFQAIRVLENYLSRYPRATYYDVIGIVPERASLRVFAGPDDPKTNRTSAQRLVANPPDLIFYVRKMSYLEPEIGRLLKERYVAVATDVYAKWEVFNPPLSLNAKKADDLKVRLNAMRAAVGATGSENFSARIQIGKGVPREFEGSVSELLALQSKTRTPVKVLALSPFARIRETIPGSLSYLFRFDGSP